MEPLQDPNKVKGIWVNLETLKENWAPGKESLNAYIERTAGKIEMNFDSESGLSTSWKVLPPPPRADDNGSAACSSSDPDSLGTGKPFTFTSKSKDDEEIQDVKDFLTETIARQYFTGKGKATTPNSNGQDKASPVYNGGKDMHKSDDEKHFTKDGGLVTPPEVGDFITNHLGDLTSGSDLSVIGSKTSSKIFIENENDLVEAMKKAADSFDISTGNRMVEIEIQEIDLKENPSNMGKTAHTATESAMDNNHETADEFKHGACHDSKMKIQYSNKPRALTPGLPNRTGECCHCGAPLQTISQTALDLQVLEKAINRIEKREAGELVPVTKDLKQALPRSVRRKTQHNRTLTINDSLGLDKEKQEFPDQLIQVYGEALMKREIYVTREYALGSLYKSNGKIVPAIEELENHILTRELAIDRTGRFSRAVEYNLIDSWRSDPHGNFAKDEILNYLEDEDREMIIFEENPVQSYFYYLITQYFGCKRQKYWIDIFSVEAQYRSERQKVFNCLMKNVELGQMTREKLGQMMDQFDGLTPPRAEAPIEPHRAATEKRRLARKKFFTKTLDERPKKETDPKAPPSRAVIQKAVQKLLSEELN
ncbi:hypothetical protein B7463_g12174, partial [Scytalidium lignicola]